MREEASVKRQRPRRYWADILTTINGVEVTGAYSVEKRDWMTARMNEEGQSTLAAVPPPKALRA
jgi:hypothetical protein